MKKPLILQLILCVECATRSLAQPPSYYVLPLLDRSNEDDNDVRRFEMAMRELAMRKTFSMDRTFISYILPLYRVPTECKMGPGGSCQLSTLPEPSLFLERGRRFDIVAGLRRLLHDADNLPRSQLAVFTDVPCAAVQAQYPDLAELFDSRWPSLLDVVLGRKLHLYVFWSNMEDNGRACKNLLSYETGRQPLITVITSNWTDAFLLETARVFSATWDDSETPDTPDGPPGRPTAEWLLVGGGLAGAALLSLGLAWGARWRRRARETSVRKFAHSHKSSARAVHQRDPLELDAHRLSYAESAVLGSGVCANVYRGHLSVAHTSTKPVEKTVVAVKVAHVNAKQSVRNDMLREIALMKSIGAHTNILSLVGCISDPLNPVIVTAFCSNGDLLHVLRKHPVHIAGPKCSREPLCLDFQAVVHVLYQVADAMYVHRDLAARNVLLTEDFTPKVADFGLCRKYLEAQYTQQSGKLPIKHMALESIRHFRFDEKTDVWSFGVLVFECLSGGAPVFPDVPNADMLGHLEQGNRPELPDNTPTVMRNLAQQCWQADPSQRPTFTALQQDLQSMRIPEQHD